MSDIDREYAGHQAIRILNEMLDAIDKATNAELAKGGSYTGGESARARRLHKRWNQLLEIKKYVEQLSGVRGTVARPIDIWEINRMLRRRVDTIRPDWARDVLINSKILAFILCCCEIDDDDPDCWTPTADLTDAFTEWEYGPGEYLKPEEFGTRLRQTGTGLVSKLRRMGGKPRKGWYVRLLPRDQWRDGVDEAMLQYWPPEWLDKNMWYPPQPKPDDPVGSTWRERATDFLDRFVVPAQYGTLDAEALHRTLIDQCGDQSEDKEGLDADGQPLMPFTPESTPGWLAAQYRARFGHQEQDHKPRFRDEAPPLVWKGYRLVWTKWVPASQDDDEADW